MDALRKTGLVLVGFNRSSISEPDPNKILYCGGVERVPQDALHEDGLNAVVARIAERIETVAFSGGMRADTEDLPIEIYLTWEDPDGEYALLLWRVPIKAAEG
jgi:hypothetical protein